MVAVCLCNMQPVQQVCFDVLPAALNFASTNEKCVDTTSGRHFICIMMERDWESSRMRASMLFCVKTRVCTLATIVKDEETDGEMWAYLSYLSCSSPGSQPP